MLIFQIPGLIAQFNFLKNLIKFEFNLSQDLDNRFVKLLA